MLPRRQSIFHLGEEGGVAVHHRGGGLIGAAGGGARRARERERRVVGLQILVHHHHHHHGRHAHVHPANVVMKPMVRPFAAAVSCSSAFLKSCSLCRLELSPNKDVYMYRGDQGFCSEECRWQQIMVDEARERDAAGGSKERQRRGQARHHTPHHMPVVRGRPPRKTLAVAY